MRKMVALLVLGSSLALVGTPAFAETQLPHFLDTVSAQGSDNPDTMEPSYGTVDPSPRLFVHPETDK